MKYYIQISLLLVLFVAIISGTGCKKDTLTTSSSAKLSFSVDTLTFDTVFTTLGSTTLPLKVYNRNDNKVNVSRIWIGGGEASVYRMNVDGLPGDAEDIEINGKDSIYIFVEVTLDPSNQNNPLVVFDSINFLTNGNEQQVTLAAWGQDAHYYVGQEICDEVWTNDKPYVIFNSILIDAGCKLTIQEGVNVHFSDNSSMFVFGTLEVNGGCNTDTVIFRGLRLEDFYDDLPGQWGGISIFRGSEDNVLRNVEVVNSSTGITVGSDTTCDLTQYNAANAPDLILDRVVVKNSLSTGLYGFLSVIDAQNCLIYGAGDNLLSLIMGGVYRFSYCSFLNYGSVTTNHEKPILTMSNFAAIQTDECDVAVAANLDVVFTNTILDGSLDEEIEFNNETTAGADFLYKFDHCLLKTEYNTTATAVTDSFVNCLINLNPNFADRAENDYHLAAGSPCVAAAKAGTPVMDDLDCIIRNDPSDIGAYEYVD